MILVFVHYLKIDPVDYLLAKKNTINLKCVIETVAIETSTTMINSSNKNNNNNNSNEMQNNKTRKTIEKEEKSNNVVRILF